MTRAFSVEGREVARSPMGLLEAHDVRSPQKSLHPLELGDALEGLGVDGAEQPRSVPGRDRHVAAR